MAGSADFFLKRATEVRKVAVKFLWQEHGGVVIERFKRTPVAVEDSDPARLTELLTICVHAIWPTQHDARRSIVGELKTFDATTPGKGFCCALSP